MVQIELLNRQALKAFIYSEEYEESEHLPISRHRAWSHINNPRAGDEDVLLLIARADGKIVGYLGVLPDKIFQGERAEKIGWLSCLWVNPAYRGRKIAWMLVQKSFEVWDGKIVLTEYTRPAQKLYEKIGRFLDLKTHKGLRIYRRSALRVLLPPRGSFWAKVKPLLGVLDRSINFFIDALSFYRNMQVDRFFSPAGDFRLEYVSFVDEEAGAFIFENREKELFKRGCSELNWMLRYPWILSAPGSDRNSRRYYFSSLEPLFRFIPVKVYRNKELIAFLIFAQRNKHLKLPYCYFRAGEWSAVRKTIEYHLVKWKIELFTVFHPVVVPHLKSDGKYLSREIKRNYLIASFFEQLVGASGDAVIQDGDGDCGFT